MIIAQISDTHIALDTPDADQRIRDFALTVADINRLDPAVSHHPPFIALRGFDP